MLQSKALSLLNRALLTTQRLSVIDAITWRFRDISLTLRQPKVGPIKH